MRLINVRDKSDKEKEKKNVNTLTIKRTNKRLPF